MDCIIAFVHILINLRDINIYYCYYISAIVHFEFWPFGIFFFCQLFDIF
jgi:hypothetical protein